MEKLKKKDKSAGITLIALVITIIVLLLLAGISIMMLTGNNGMLQRATDAKDLTRIAQIQEEFQLAINGLLVEYSTQDRSSGTFRDYIFNAEKGQAKLKAELGANNLSFDTTKHQITYKNIIFDIAEDGVITKNVGSANSNNEENQQGLYVNGIKISDYSAETVFKNMEYFIKLWTNEEQNVANGLKDTYSGYTSLNEQNYADVKELEEFQYIFASYKDYENETWYENGTVDVYCILNNGIILKTNVAYGGWNDISQNYEYNFDPQGLSSDGIYYGTFSYDNGLQGELLNNPTITYNGQTVSVNLMDMFHNVLDNSYTGEDDGEYWFLHECDVTPNPDFWINDKKISSHHAYYTALAIGTILKRNEAGKSNIPGYLEEFGIENLIVEKINNYSAKLKITFTNYNECECVVQFGLEQDEETGDYRTAVGDVYFLLNGNEAILPSDPGTFDHYFVPLLRNLVQSFDYEYVMSLINNGFTYKTNP